MPASATLRGGKGSLLRATLPGAFVVLSFASAAALIPLGRTVAQDDPPTFRSDAEVVILDVIVRDGKGRPVRDLRPGEVQVTEDGRGCELRSLRAVQTPLEGPAPTGRKAAGPTPESPPAPAVPPAARPSRPPIVVLLFDQLDPDASRRAARAANDWLAQPIPTGTLFSVYQLGVSLRQLQPLTADRTVVAATLRQRLALVGAERDGPVGYERPNVHGPSTNATEQAFRGLERQAQGGGRLEPGEIDPRVLYYWDRVYRENEGRSAVGALRAVVDALAIVEGRKSVLFFSEGIHTPGELEASLLQDTISAANRANVSIYTIDSKGLTTERPDRDKQAAIDAAGAGAVSADMPGMMTDILLPGPQANLRILASFTGGLATTNTDRLAAALGRVTDDVSSYYEVVYVPPRAAPDGRFHRTAVKVLRPGVSVRTRSGYIANGGSATVAATEWPLLEALAHPPKPTAAAALPFRQSVLFFGRRGADRETVVLVEVPLSGVRVTVDEATRRYRAHLSALVLIKDAAGRPVSRMSRDWPFEGPEEEAERRKAGRNLFRHVLGLAPGRYVLQTAVRDEDAGQVSTTSAEFEVPAPDEALTAGSLVLVRRTQTAALENPADPLRLGRVDIVPSVEPLPVEPTEGAGVGYFVRAYVPPGAEAPTATLEIRRGGALRAHATPKLSAPDADGRIGYLGRVPVDKLPPGAYELELTLRTGDHTATSRASFEIGERPPPVDAATPAPAAAAPTAGLAAETAPSPSPLAPRPTDPALVKLLERAGRYVTDYADKFRNVVAEEDYRQVVTPAYEPASNAVRLTDQQREARRRTRADLVFVTLPGAFSWASFRDVFEVDGAPVRDRDARLEKLFRSDPVGAAERARQIVQESARYNLGSVRRTLNIPTLPLLFLSPANQARFVFRVAREGRNSGMAAVEVQFDEIARPSLFRDPGARSRDLPVEGLFWIDPVHGIVLRSVVRFHFAERRDGTAGRGDGTILTQYRYEPELRLWVPSEMEERYETGTETSAVARYSNFRQFTVSTDEQAKLPEAPR